MMPRLHRPLRIAVAAVLAGVVFAARPALADDALPAAMVLLKKFDASAAAAVASAPLRAKLSPAEAASLKRLGATFARTRDVGALSRDWQQFIATAKPLPVDINSLIQWVLRESYMESAADLRTYAEKVKALNEKKKALRQQLSTVGDDAQLANVDLQNVLQKQQQTLQMMSNISKMMHDTAMAIIRKIGG